MAVFSFRAECSRDVQEFLAAMRWAEIMISGLLIQPIPLNGEFCIPDVEGEFYIKDDDVTVERLRRISSDVADIHVLLETLRPVSLSENSLERDWDGTKIATATRLNASTNEHD
jgi:hypothetical protein